MHRVLVGLALLAGCSYESSSFTHRPPSSEGGVFDGGPVVAGGDDAGGGGGGGGGGGAGADAAPTAIVPPPDAGPSCRAGYQLIGAHCFKAVGGPKRGWLAAQVDCQQDRGSLAIIGNRTLELRVRALPDSGDDFWIGLSDINQEGQFVWVDGAPLTWADWKDGQPDDDHGDQDCVTSGKDGWSDRACAEEHGFVCEAEPR